MIHPSSVVDSNAQIGNNVKIDPFVHIHGDVVIGDDCWIGSGSVIMSGTRMGNNCKVFPNAVIGADPQDLKYAGEETYLEIGNNVVIRECCTINRATVDSGTTRIGDNCLLMAYVHVAHDCQIGKNCIFSNCVNLAGHVVIEDHVILGGMVPVHQFVKVGQHAFVGGGSLVRKDVPPFVKAAREPLSYVGINSIGLSRRGFSKADISCINEMYRIIYVSGFNMTTALSQVESNVNDCAQKDIVLNFIRSSERGLIRGYNG